MAYILFLQRFKKTDGAATRGRVHPLSSDSVAAAAALRLLTHSFVAAKPCRVQQLGPDYPSESPSANLDDGPETIARVSLSASLLPQL